MGLEKEIVESSYSVYRYMGHELPTQYENFVRSKWMRSYRYGNDYIKLIDSDSYFAAYSAYITHLIFYKPHTEVRLAVLSDDTDVALGFCVTNRHVLEYIHVHKDYRRLGIAKALMPSEIEAFTHLTRTGMKLWAVQMPHAIFNPFALGERQ